MKVRVITSFNDKTEGLLTDRLMKFLSAPRAEQKTFKSLYYQKDEMNKVRILGKAVGFYSNVL